MAGDAPADPVVVFSCIAGTTYNDNSGICEVACTPNSGCDTCESDVAGAPSTTCIACDSPSTLFMN